MSNIITTVASLLGLSLGLAAILVTLSVPVFGFPGIILILSGLVVMLVGVVLLIGVMHGG